MKSIIIISTILIGISINAPAAASNLPLHHTYELPSSVVISLAHRYGHFDLIHTARTQHQGRLAFNLVLQHGTSYVSVTSGIGGHLYGESYHRNFPLHHHYCNEFCSFQYAHYGNGHFSGYDPYYGCHTHVNLIVSRYPAYRYRPYYGYRSVHYHAAHKTYKHFRQDRRHSKDFHVHRPDQRHDQFFNKKPGNNKFHKKEHQHHKPGKREDRVYHDQRRARRHSG